MALLGSIKLVVIEGADTGATVTYDGERLTIGRSSSADFVLKDNAVSRNHAAIEHAVTGFTLVDLGSNNGTFVEGEKGKISRRALSTGDVFTLGKTKIQVEVSLPIEAGAVDGTAPTRLVDPKAKAAPAPAPSASAAALEPPAAAAEAPPTVAAVQPSDLPIVLTVISGPDRGMVYSPSKDAISIGRLSTSDVPLSDPAVSRVHAAIKRESDGYVLYDENSRYGVHLVPEEKQIFHHSLRGGERVRMGNSEILIDIGAGKSSEESASGTQLFGSIGDKTFAMSLKSLGLGAHPPVRSAIAESELTMVPFTARPAAPEPEHAEAPPPSAAPPPPPPPAPPEPEKPRIVLRATTGDAKGQTVAPPEGTARFTVGRTDKADFQINDPGVSSLHFSITESGGEFVLKDEGSRNGTFLNRRSERVTSATLHSGDVVHVGATDLVVEISGGAAAAVPRETDGTMVVSVPTPAAPPPPPPPAAKPPPAAAAPPGGKGKPEPPPELARSAAAKERISKIMKGVSLRPVRKPGSLRQWATAAAVLLAVLVSYAFPRTWLAAGPVHQGHEPIEQKCETCHASASSSLLSVASFGTGATAMDATCASAGCHADVLRNKPEVRDDCVSCHVEHRGRSFPIRGGADLCWSCHRGQESPVDFDTRLMRIAIGGDAALRERLAEQIHTTEIGLKFSHPAHDKETKGDKKFDQCIGCHSPIDDARTFSMPGHAVCIDCHENAVSEDVKVAQQKAGKDCLQCHTQESGEMVKPPPSPFAYVSFAHRDHGNESCQSCHASIWTEGGYRSVLRKDNLYPVPMDACFTCHTQKLAAIDCLSCHREHHSFPSDGQEPAPVEARSSGFDGFLLAMLGLVLGGFAYIFADMQVAKRGLAPPPASVPAAGGKAADGAKAAEPAGEIMPFPKVDVEACISCSSCYNSCPKQVLAGGDHGKSTVVNPQSCIAQTEGCAICEQGCPTGAIRVSTAPLKRTVERPEIDEHNEATKIPGIFFAGEVIGAALIKSAINQGNQDVTFIAEKKPKIADAPYDVIIVGAGPAGLGAALEAKRRQLKYLILERDTVASTIKNYPRDKAVLAEPIKMPLYGQLPMMDAEKDTLMEVWKAVVRTTGLEVNEFEEVVDVRKQGGLLEVTTVKGKHLGANVILAIGTRGNPRKLGCTGEDPRCVSYNLIDANDFRGKSVIVVGGGDSAIEAAVALAKVEGAKVTLSYRKGGFSRVKKRNQEAIDEMAKAGRIELAFNSQVTEIRLPKVVLKTESGDREVACDQVFALIGADPPKGWIEKLGVPFVMREEEVVTWS